MRTKVVMAVVVLRVPVLLPWLLPVLLALLVVLVLLMVLPLQRMWELGQLGLRQRATRTARLCQQEQHRQRRFRMKGLRMLVHVQVLVEQVQLRLLP
jgi:hypothetical protein